MLAGISGSGLYYLTFEFRPYKLWVKEPSKFKRVHEWKMEKFPNTIRKHIAIWETDNILTAKAINQMWVLHQEIESSRSSKSGVRYSDVCLRVPSLINSKSDTEEKEEKHEENYDFDTIQSNDKKTHIVNKRDAQEEYDDYDYDLYDSAVKNHEVPAWLSNDKSKPSTEVETQTKENVQIPLWLTNEKNIPPRSESYYLSSENASREERNDHCEFVEDLELICYEESLLEVWGYDDKVIKSLTDKQVIEDINNFSSSRVTGFPINITSYLGGISSDRFGNVIAAKGALNTWYTQVDMKAISECEKLGCKIEIDLGSGEEVDERGMEWEIHLTNVVNKFKDQGVPVNLQASYLFGAVHRSALFQDFIWVCTGWVVLIMYVVVTLGKPFSSDRNIVPVLVGIACVGLSVMASYGICTASGIPYGPLNSVLPILLIALGVDDMYVILNSWESCKNDETVVDIKTRARKMLHQAGLAITVTSLTDVIAFVIGATTEVPALRYFCVYAAVGISVVYFLQITLFVAAIILNQKSKEKSEKTSCLPSICNASSDKNVLGNEHLGKWLGKWVRFLLQPPVTAFVLLSTGLLLGGAISQTLELEQRFESTWLLPTSSDIYKWFKTMDRIFPKDGRDGFVFFENVKLPEELPELQILAENLRRNPFVSRVDAWFDKLTDFIDREDLFKNKNMTSELFYDSLSYFLFNEDGAKYRNDIVFSNNTKLRCIEPAPKFTTFKISFRYRRLNPANGEYQDAMNSVRQIVSSANLTGYRAPWALSYGQWETENVISYELLRNVSIVLVIIFVMTMVLLASFRAALLVLTCVLATLVEVAALMNFWGVTINTVSCIALVLAIGICVDYAAHITHGFLVAQGSRKFRAESALNHMGAAVLHGGISTLIAFVMLAPSDTFIFVSYFKILTGVAIFGLYNAMVVLPILLAMLGPPPYPISTKNTPAASEDSHSCTTESTNFPCTPSSITPAVTPQSTTPNSPSSDRTVNTNNSNPAFVNDDGTSSGKIENQLLTPLYKQLPRQNSKIGPQAISNMTLSESSHKVNMFIKGNKKNNEDLEEIKNFSLVENPAIRKENVLKLYIKNS
ncbi:Patched-related protein 9 [Armadillidium vulgare]|nr:Patched-related protein 9 [Armadillidium vulgare]